MTVRKLRDTRTSRLLWHAAYLVAVAHDAALEWAFSDRTGSRAAWRLSIRLGALRDRLSDAAVRRGKPL